MTTILLTAESNKTYLFVPSQMRQAFAFYNTNYTKYHTSTSSSKTGVIRNVWANITNVHYATQIKSQTAGF